MEWLCCVGPLEGLSHGAVEVGDEGQHLVAQVGHGGEAPAAEQLADQDAQPEFDLVDA